MQLPAASLFYLLERLATEVYCPTVDQPEPRDFQYIITDAHPVRPSTDTFLVPKMRCLAKRVTL
jgi:hypothetical protein